MAAQDYEAMHEVDGSDEATAFVERMENDRYLIFRIATPLRRESAQAYINLARAVTISIMAIMRMVREKETEPSF